MSQDFETSGLVYKSTFRFTFDPKRDAVWLTWHERGVYLVRAAWWLLRGEGRYARSLLAVARQGWRMRGVIYNAGS